MSDGLVRQFRGPNIPIEQFSGAEAFTRTQPTRACSADSPIPRERKANEMTDTSEAPRNRGPVDGPVYLISSF